MYSVVLSPSAIMDESIRSSRLTTSMFNAEQSMLYRPSITDMSVSTFIGSDPSLGVSVLRISKKSQSISQDDGLEIQG